MCLNSPFEVKNQLTSYFLLFSIFYLLRNFWGSAKIPIQITLKMGKIEEDCESSIFFEAQKYYFVFEWRLIFFSNGHICNVVLTLINVVKIDVENDKVISTLSNVVQFNVEVHNFASTLLNVVNFNVDVHNVVLTMIWCCATSRFHINLNTTLKRRWNGCWVESIDTELRVYCLPLLF